MNSTAPNVIAALYADANQGWDARNAFNEIIAVGAGSPTPRIGETLDEWIERRDREVAAMRER